MCIPWQVRELWLQQNKIARVAGLESLVHLENLGLAGNKINDYLDLQRLSLLPSLRSVSFDDIHFGSCPVTKLDGYRNFALCYLKQVTHLDGLEVTRVDREKAEEAYVEEILAFNNRIEEVTREGGREAKAIEARRARTKSHGDALKNEMVGAFDMLENLVKDGLSNLHAEHSRQILVRKDNQKALESSLKNISRSYAQEISKQLEDERNKERTEERAFALLEGRTVAERSQALMVSTLQVSGGCDWVAQDDRLKSATQTLALLLSHRSPLCSHRLLPLFTRVCAPPLLTCVRWQYEGSAGGIACQFLGEHLPDFQFLVTNFCDAQKLHTPQSKEALTVLKGHRIYNEQLATTFEAASNTSDGKVLSLYMCCGIDKCEQVFREGILDDVVLFSDPGMAVRVGSFPMDKGDVRGVVPGDEAPQEEKKGEDEDDPVKAAMDISRPLRQVMGDEDEFSEVEDDSEDNSSSKKTGAEKGKEFAAYFMIQVKMTLSLFSTVNLDEPPKASKDVVGLMSQIPQSAQALKVTYEVGGEGAQGEAEKGQMYCVRQNKTSGILPEYHFLCAGSVLKAEIRRVEELLDKMNSLSSFGLDPAGDEGGEVDPNEVLRTLENKIEDECRRYQEALWEEVDPSTADKLRHADTEVRRREDMVGKARESIENERETQEHMLRDFRSMMQGARGGGGGGGGRGGEGGDWR